jgi:hypothetical protein
VLSALDDGYFVEWEDTPGVPVFILGTRLRAVKPRPSEPPMEKR